MSWYIHIKFSYADCRYIATKFKWSSVVACRRILWMNQSYLTNRFKWSDLSTYSPFKLHTPEHILRTISIDKRPTSWTNGLEKVYTETVTNQKEVSLACMPISGGKKYKKYAITIVRKYTYNNHFSLNFLFNVRVHHSKH